MGKMNTITKDYMSQPKYFAVSEDEDALSKLQNDETFQSVDVKTVQLLNECTNSWIPIDSGKEEVNVCKGLIGMMENARMEERTDLVKKKLARGCSVEQIADALEQSVESIQEIIDGLKN